jgi:rhodanese-related sulfurtransferase
MAKKSQGKHTRRGGMDIGEWFLIGIVVLMVALAAFMAVRSGSRATVQATAVPAATLSDGEVIATRAAYMSTFLPTLTVPAGPTPEGGISADDAYVFFKGGAYFLDVRAIEDFGAYRITTSSSIPLDELRSRAGEIPQDKDVVIVCFYCEDCLQAQAILQAAGYTKVHPMIDGIESWVIKGYPFEGNFPY